MKLPGILGLLVAALATATHADDNPKGPNVIVILADDLGYGDIGCFGCKDIPTPNIDGLAREGVMCRAGYVTAAICSPSRVAILTGRYQQRAGFYTNPPPEWRAWRDRIGLDTSVELLPERLKRHGYRTGAIGKWHLGTRPEFHPNRRGFDEFFGFTGGMRSYLPGPTRFWDHGNDLERDGKPVEWGGTLTDVFTREACDFVRRHRAGPFFLYLAYNAPHAPLQAPPAEVGRFDRIEHPNRRVYAAMVAALDRGVGEVVGALREAGVRDNTLIVFLSDNGARIRGEAGGSNAPLSGEKGDFLEGGVRVPFVVSWPARLPRGVVYEHPVSALDIAPTVLGAALGTASPKAATSGTGARRGQPHAEFDGVDLIPFLIGADRNRPHERLYWLGIGRDAVRWRDWKLVRDEGAGTTRLFDLATDPREERNLADKQPEMGDRLARMWEQWSETLKVPAFGNPTKDDYREARRLCDEGIEYWKETPAQPQPR